MPIRRHAISVKLDDEEFLELRKQPGENDAERVRSLLHSRAINEHLTQAISTEVARRLTVAVASDGDRTRKVIMNLAEQINNLLTAMEAKT